MVHITSQAGAHSFELVPLFNLTSLTALTATITNLRQAQCDYWDSYTP